MQELVAEVCAGGLCAPPQTWLIGGGAGGAAIVAAGITWAWLAWLRWLPVMGGFTRLRSDRLLDHPVRERIHALVAAQPGIHQQRLIDEAGLGKGQASHHLSMMVRAGLLSAVKSKGFTLYFHKGAVDANVMQALLGLRAMTARRALAGVANEPGIGKRELARQIGCSESTLRHHVQRFVARGLVREAEGLHLEPLGEQALTFLPESLAAPAWPPGSAPEAA